MSWDSQQTVGKVIHPVSASDTVRVQVSTMPQKNVMLTQCGEQGGENQSNLFQE